MAKSKKVLSNVSKKAIIAYIVIAVIIIGLIVGLTVYYYNKSSSNTPSSPTNSPSPLPTPTPTPTSTKLLTTTPTPAPTPTTSNLDITKSGGWEAWSTTTQFGAGEEDWPSGSNPSLNLPKIMNWGNSGGSALGTIKYSIGNGNVETVPVYGTMGVAIPWPIILSTYPSRTEFLNDVIDSCAGKNNSKCCYIIQPIQKYPTEVKNKGDNHNQDVTNGKGADLNGAGIVSKYGDISNPTSYPAYFCVPYEGCGGDCNKEAPDCFNSCAEYISNIVLTPNFFSTIDTSQLPVNCKPALTIWGNSQNNWAYYNGLDAALLNAGNDPVSISDATENGTNIANIVKNTPTNHVNYCSGKNMHFDVAQNSPLWQMAIKNPISGQVVNMSNSTKATTDITNTMVRFIRVPGNIFGNFDVASFQCGANSWNNHASPCPPGTSGYMSGDINCCCSGSSKDCSVSADGKSCNCNWS